MAKKKKSYNEILHELQMQAVMSGNTKVTDKQLAKQAKEEYVAPLRKASPTSKFNISSSNISPIKTTISKAKAHKDKSAVEKHFGSVGKSILTGAKNVGNFVEKQIIEPIGDFGQNYKYGKLTEDLGMEAYKKMMGEDNEYDKLKIVHDEFLAKNPELINDVQLLDQTIQTLPNSLGGLVSGIKRGGIGAAAGAVAGGIIGGAGAAIGTSGTGTVAGATAGATTGAKMLGGAGYVAGSSEYTYKLEAGLQYQTLIEMGVPEDIAKEESKDTGLINALIESGESVLDLVTLGGVSALKTTLAKGLAKKYGIEEVSGWIGKNVVRNAVSEGLEESLQEATSIHNEKQAMKRAGLERDDSQDKERIIQSGLAGGFAGGITGGVTGVVTGATKVGINTIQNKNKTDNTAQIQGLQQEIAKETEELNKTQDAREKQIRQEKIDNLNQELNEITNAQTITDENELRKQNFTYEAQETDSDIRKSVYESASQVMNNTQNSHKFVDVVAKIAEERGTTYKFTNNEQLKQLGYTKENATINGLVSENGEVLVNIDSKQGLDFIVGHETTHLLEGTKEYDALKQVAIEYAKSKGDYDARIESLTNLYEGTNADIESELTSDIVGEYLFTDENFIKELSVKQPTVFEKIKNFISDLVVKFKGTEQEKQLRQLQRSFEKAYKAQNTQTNTDTKYSFLGEEILSNNRKEMRKLRVAKELNEQGKSNNYIRQNTGWFKGEDGNWKFEIDDSNIKLKRRLKENRRYRLGDILDHESLYSMNDNYKNIEVVTGNIEPGGGYSQKKGRIVLSNYILNNNKAVKSVLLHEIQHATQHAEGWEGGTNPEDAGSWEDYKNNFGERESTEVQNRMNMSAKKRSKIAPSIQKKARYSLTDNQGRTLTKEQQEYFKDSKVRDENGRLLEVYHGTSNAGFTVYDSNKLGETTGSEDSKIGFHLTDNINLATFFSGVVNETTYNESKNEIYTKYGIEENETIPFDFKAKINQEIEELSVEKAKSKGEVKKQYINITKPMSIFAEYGINEKQLADDLVYAITGEADIAEITDYYEDNVDFLTAVQQNFDNELAQLKDELAKTESIKRLQELGYDGLILPMTATDVATIKESGLEYITFNSNQIKNVDNTKPTTNPDIRYSLSEDTEGRKLTENQKEYFKNVIPELKDENGNLKVLYHGTPNEFTQFNYDFIGSNGTALGKGFYLTDDKSVAEGYVGEKGHVMEVYANITKPMLYQDRSMTKAEYKKFVEAVDKATEGQFLSDYGEVDYEGYKTVLNRALQDYEYGGDDIDLVHGVLNTAGLTWEEGFRILKDTIGYDGVVSNKGFLSKEGTVYIPTLPEQIKSVTNENPTENPDINLSLSAKGEETAPIGNVFGKDLKVQVEEAIAPLQEKIESLTEQLDTVVNSIEQKQEVPKVAPTPQPTRPTLEEVQNLMNIKETQSGSDYARAFFALRDKYGQPNLYKSLNEYNKTGTIVEESNVQNIDTAPVSQEIVEQERQANMNSLVNEVAPIDSGLTTEESNMLDAYEEHINTHGIESLDTEERNTYNELKQRKELDTTPESAKEKIKVESPLYDRDIDKVGNRKIKAYQYENPEVKPYFQQEAQSMLGDLDNTIKGERIPLFDEDGYIREWTGTSRQTTEAIAYLKDNFGYSYEQIRQGLNKIIEDDGKENNAVSKRIEFMLDERLREGYTTSDGFPIPPNEEYINFLNEKQITEYNKEAFNALTDLDVPSDIAPEAPGFDLRQNSNISEQLIPMTEKVAQNQNMNEEYLAISPEKSSEPRMVRVKEPQKLGKVEGRVTEPTIPEPVKDAKQLTLDGTEEDLFTKTRKQLRKELIEPNKELFANALDNAKNRSMAFMNNTDTIRNTELVFGREAGKAINDAIFQKEIDNEADSISWQNKERQEIKDLGIKARSKESAAVQKYGEKQYVNEEGKLVPYGDAELAREFPDIDTQNNIKQAARVIRNKYDNYIDEANEVLTRLGFDPIKKRKDYMRHFQELTDVFSRNGIPFNAKNMQEHVLPTDINGLTEFWSPQKNYFASMQPRKGIKTNYDAITGIDGYISGISNLIFHTEDIQRGRAFEELIRETYGEAKGWENLEKLPDELKQARADKIQENHLSNYAAWVHEWTNNVAGKKNKLDRSVEATFGRKAFSVLDEIRKQVGSNMIGFNASSALTNLVAPMQAMSKTNKLAMAKGTADTIKNIFVKDNFIEKNKFLTSRFGTDMLSKNAWQRIQDAGFVFMKGTDWFTANQIVRSKYYELRAKGLSDADAHTQAGQFAARIMGDRTKGAAPQLYNSKLVGLVTQFQLEVNNQLYSQFYDTYHESKENAKGNALKTAAGMTFTLGQLFAFTHLFGQTFESIAGYNPTFDVIEMIKTAFGWGEDEDEEKTTSERLKAAADQLVDALPYVNILTGGGRIPIASGIPNLVGVATGATDNYGNEITLEDELKKLLYLIPPTGGNQFKKTTQGLSMFDDDFPIAGSYTDSGNLRYTVEDNAANRLQAGLFGKWANKNAQAYIDSDFQTIDKNNIEELVELGFDSNEYRKYKKGLNEIKRMELEDGESIAPILFDYIDKQDVTEEQKSIMIKHLLGDKELEDLSELDMSPEQTIDYYNARTSITQEIAEYSNDKSLLTGDTESEEYKEAVSELSNERKSNIIDTIKNTNLTDEQKAYLYGKHYSSDKTLDKVIESGIDFDDFLTYSKDSLSIESTEDKAKYLYNSNMTDKAKTVIYETSVLSGFDDEKKYKDYKTAKAVGVDINSWLSYKKQEFVADKDSDGDSIRGSRKDKIFSFINSLDLNDAQKAIMKRTEYSTYDDYNNSIVNYVNGLDLEYEEKIKVLENLDFTIGSDGYVYWD